MGKRNPSREPGKRRRAVSRIEEMPAAQEPDVEVVEVISPAANVLNISSNDSIVGLYSVGHEEITRTMCEKGVEVPFQHTLHILGPQGEIVRVSALFDGCAMVAAMCSTVFNKVKHRLGGQWGPSERWLRMGNGTIVPSMAVWKGKMKLGGVTIDGEFEVFDSGGSWAFLLGKPLLKSFRVEQAYWPDTVSIRSENDEKEVLFNQIRKVRAGGDKPGINLTLDVKQYDTVVGGSSDMKPPSREVSYSSDDMAKIYINEISAPVCVISKETDKTDPESLLTWESDPFKSERVEKIIQEVMIGPDVTEAQCLTICDLIREYADCFALSIKEVNVIPGAVHKLNIPEGATFHTKIPPQSYNPEQRVFVNAKVDEMLEAGIIRSIHHSQVRFVAQTVLAQKAHEGQGLGIEELRYKVNDQCLKHGLPKEFDLPPVPLIPVPESSSSTKRDAPIKWCMCQDFGGINKVRNRLQSQRCVHIGGQKVLTALREYPLVVLGQPQ